MEGMMKTKLENMIKEYVENYPKNKDTKSKWREPLISYADADDKEFYTLKEIVSPTHALPKDFLQEATTVVTYFIPFDESIVKSNINDKYSSKEWALAYIETNKLIFELNTFVMNELKKIGYKSNVIPATHNFNEKKLISDWSHRHVAVIAGLGTFGLNNMIITEKGCCGRVGSFVTDIKINPTSKIKGENCLYKSMNICKKCVDRCVNDALKIESFNRYKCYEMCLDNDRYHSHLGLMDICGKCLVDLPCSTKNPINR
jgi:epoxyqueuosine reductase QueG